MQCANIIEACKHVHGRMHIECTCLNSIDWVHFSHKESKKKAAHTNTENKLLLVNHLSVMEGEVWLTGLSLVLLDLSLYLCLQLSHSACQNSVLFQCGDRNCAWAPVST